MPCLVQPLQFKAGCNGGVWTLSAVLPISPDEPVRARLPQYLAGKEVSGEIVCKFWQCSGPLRMTAEGGNDSSRGGGWGKSIWNVTGTTKTMLSIYRCTALFLSAGGRSIQIGVCNVILGSWVYFFLRGKDHAESVYTCMSIQTWNKVTCLLISHCPHQLSRILINWDYTNFHSGWIHLTYH